jgi:hypothetical protein
MDVIEYVNKHPQLKQLVHYHNVNTQGVPPNYRNKINRVPTMLTKNGKVLVGNEIKNWLDSLLPAKEITQAGLGGMACGMTSLDGGGGVSDMFSLDDYGRTLQPPMTKGTRRENQSGCHQGCCVHRFKDVTRISE